ncbi:MAG: toxin-activating lysine-acyltransferase [Rubrimonas sp.]|uniref:toxin-activating lysine-acyltransferase n=1 Tax=Rubrimonas sp. TaxID=2036015 RepID=UPI002FDEBDCA
MTEAPDAPGAAAERFALLGEALWLFAHAPLQGGFPLAEAAKLLTAPLSLGQFRIWRRGARPMGIATWALLSDEIAEAALREGRPLEPQDWRSGGRVVVADFVAPFGEARAMVADLRRNALRGRDIEAARRAPDGSLRRVARYPALDADGRRVGGGPTCDGAHRPPEP